MLAKLLNNNIRTGRRRRIFNIAHIIGGKRSRPMQQKYLPSQWDAQPKKNPAIQIIARLVKCSPLIF